MIKNIDFSKWWSLPTTEKVIGMENYDEIKLLDFEIFTSMLQFLILGW